MAMDFFFAVCVVVMVAGCRAKCVPGGMSIAGYERCSRESCETSHVDIGTAVWRTNCTASKTVLANGSSVMVTQCCGHCYKHETFPHFGLKGCFTQEACEAVQVDNGTAVWNERESMCGFCSNRLHGKYFQRQLDGCASRKACESVQVDKALRSLLLWNALVSQCYVCSWRVARNCFTREACEAMPLRLGESVHWSSKIRNPSSLAQGLCVWCGHFTEVGTFKVLWNGLPTCPTREACEAVQVDNGTAVWNGRWSRCEACYKPAVWSEWQNKCVVCKWPPSGCVTREACEAMRCPGHQAQPAYWNEGSRRCEWKCGAYSSMGASAGDPDDSENGLAQTVGGISGGIIGFCILSSFLCWLLYKCRVWLASHGWDDANG